MITPIYNLNGVPEALKKFQFKIRRLTSFREPLKLMQDDFFALQRNWLDSEGRGAWPDLKPRYLKWKIAKVGNKPMLQFSGGMYDDLTGASAGGTRLTSGELQIRAVKSGRLWMYHEQGSSKGNKSGRPRPVRKVLSPALRIRRARWDKLIRDWAAGVAVNGRV